MPASPKEKIAGVFRRNIKTAEDSLRSVLDDVEKGAEMLLGVLKNGGKVLICGNGGSAAAAQHFAAEFVGKYKDDRKPLPAVALTVDTSALTAIGNDYGFNYVFSRQVEALGKSGDVLVALTTSGKASNVLAAIAAAKRNNIKTIVLTGARGAELKNSADLAIVVPSEETARIQEIHELIIHAWCECIDEELKNN